MSTWEFLKKSQLQVPICVLILKPHSFGTIENALRDANFFLKSNHLATATKHAKSIHGIGKRKLNELPSPPRHISPTPTVTQADCPNVISNTSRPDTPPDNVEFENELQEFYDSLMAATTGLTSTPKKSLSPYHEDVEETSPPQKDKINLTKQPDEKEKEEENKEEDEKKKVEDQKKEEEKKKEQPRDEPKKDEKEKDPPKEEQKKVEEKVEEKKKDDKVGKEQPKLENKKEDEKEKEKPKEEHKKELPKENDSSALRVEKEKEEITQGKPKDTPVLSAIGLGKKEEKPKDTPVLSAIGLGKKEEKPKDTPVLSAIGLGKKEEKKEVLRELSPYKEEDPLPPPPKKERKEDNSTK
uniref:Uncharacterized protein n=1 Tax=Meloidogyne floridensis TaxID=298350 RepID=A0A915P6Q3_9BILA